MEYDIFFSISQTPDHNDFTPSEAVMFNNYFEQVTAADRLGFGVAWLAQAHLSTITQKLNSKPVVPHWQGEVGLCTDFPQLALETFRRTKRIDVGSAVVAIVASGGPIAQAERIANTVQFLSLQSPDRKLHVGFSAGRFEFMARPYGILPRNAVEEAAWPALRGQIFIEAAEIFLRLLRGDTFASDDIRSTVLTRANFRSDEDWQAVQNAAGADADAIEIERRYNFEEISIVPKEWPRNQLELIAGTHDPQAQVFVNSILPVKIFNLSITSPEIIDSTHERMREHYHPEGGKWQRRDMPRTTFVFLNAEQGLSAEQQSAAAHEEARLALSEYWKALEGTLDPEKVKKAVDNALIGNPEEVAAQALARFHPDERLMTWFDFFNHNSERVIRNMEAWMEQVVPLIERGLE
jgi:alkanesulfonate monooxygenase SsuD/methylene tetrahydromethanopterin reductase-like flavin-dependent oxidoreductase (luciferase family)